LVAAGDEGDAAFTLEFCPKTEAALIELVTVDDVPESVRAELAGVSEDMAAAALGRFVQQRMQADGHDVVVYFPPDFAAKLAEFQNALRTGAESADGGRATPADAAQPGAKPIEVPRPRIFFSSASDKSRIAKLRVDDVLDRWRNSIVQANLEKSSVSPAATEPFVVDAQDASREEMRSAAVWSKILPFVVLIWALTGAFYPAVDLCAGEKERGTLETLLSSPAQRSEIVWGKLLTIMTFSMTTSLLNMLCMGFTGLLMIQQLGGAGLAGFNLGPPPLASMGWLVLALVPISAMFSALALAVAAFARSTKEGQYYLMPLLLISLPLMIVPMLPAAELDLGTSLIPITGLMLLLRSLIEGYYLDALRYSVPVAAVTLACCLAAIRWAIDQFNNESVLFRESERFGIGTWLRHLVRDRGETPAVSAALLCGVLVLVLRFFSGLMAGTPTNWKELASSAVITQLAMIAFPALLMTLMLTRSPRKTLLLLRPHPLAVPMAVLLALALNPAVHLLAWAVNLLYPMSEGVQQALVPIEDAIRTAPWPYVLLVLAVAPAVCEELAFRGFILSGLRHTGHKWGAIGLTAALFGLAHGMLQQSLTACVVGVVIGYIAVQTSSLWPCIAYHLTHNGLGVLTARITPESLDRTPLLDWLFYFQPAAEGEFARETLEFRWPMTVVASLAAVAVLYWFRCIPWKRTEEEKLTEALEHQHVPAAVK
jgi:sodium transport system permease protein